MQRVRVVERADQLHLHCLQVGKPALQVGQLPLLDAVQLLLAAARMRRAFSACFFMAPHPVASQAMKPAMKRRSASPIVK